MASQLKDLTVLIGRFSPFHNGHAEVIAHAMRTSRAVLVLIGSSGQARTTKNPFTFEERKHLISAYVGQYFSECVEKYMKGFGNYTTCEVLIRPLNDHLYNDHSWIREVQNSVEQAKNDLQETIGLNPSVYLTGTERDKSTWYLRAFGDFFKMDLFSRSDKSENALLSATQVRDVLFKSKSLDSDLLSKNVPPPTLKFLKTFAHTESFSALVKEYEYLQKYKKIYEGLQYPVSIQTVDTCVIQSGHVLVIVRDNFPGKGLWCLPGGHLDVDKNERLVDAAIRELIEETSIGLAPAQLYGSIKSKECFDHPDRSLKARVITMCYLLKLDDSKPLPKIKPQKGEARKVMWVPINEALTRRDIWFDDHLSILETMYGRLANL